MLIRSKSNKLVRLRIIVNMVALPGIDFWDWQRFYWALWLYLLSDRVSMVIVMVQARSVEFERRRALNTRRYRFYLKYVGLIGVFIGRASFEWDRLFVIKPSVNFLAVDIPDAFHVRSIHVMRFICRLTFKFNIWPDILRLKRSSFGVHDAYYLLIVFSIVVISIGCCPNKWKMADRS